ncbi:MAG: hypothetical protein ACETV0_05330 [Nitrososphaeria archaeon]
MVEGRSRAKRVAFLVMIGALGNALGGLSIYLANTGPIGVDLSHLATFIAAVYGGPVIGFYAGALVGLFPGIYFGFIGGSLGFLGLLGLPLGKALTGLTAGWLVNALKISNPNGRSVLIVPSLLIGYLPESVFTALFFLGLVPIFLGWSSIPMLITILTKAWIEIAILSFIMLAFIRNKSFARYMESTVS